MSLLERPRSDWSLILMADDFIKSVFISVLSEVAEIRVAFSKIFYMNRFTVQYVNSRELLWRVHSILDILIFVEHDAYGTWPFLLWELGAGL